LIIVKYRNERTKARLLAYGNSTVDWIKKTIPIEAASTAPAITGQKLLTCLLILTTDRTTLSLVSSSGKPAGKGCLRRSKADGTGKNNSD
jgi:hypothetical protein